MVHQRLAHLAAAAHDEVEGTGGQAAAADDFGQRPATGGHQLGGLEHHGVAVGQGRGDLPGRDGEREVPRRDDAHHTHGLAGHIHLHALAHRGQQLALDAQRLARKKLENLPAAGHLGHAFGQCLAFFTRQQCAQLVLACQQFAADQVQHVGAALGGALAPGGQGIGGGAHGQLGLVAVGAGVFGHHLAGVRRVGADAGGGADFPPAVDQVPGAELEVAELHGERPLLQLRRSLWKV